MTYALGVDLGTTFTAAAVVRSGTATRVRLSPSGALPSVLFLSEDGSFLAGDAAEANAPDAPLAVARWFKRRIGDPTPVILSGQPFAADLLLGKLLRSVVDLVTASEGSPPDAVTVTYPANWGGYKIGLLRQAARQCGVDVSLFMTEPEAAALAYASEHERQATVTTAVYDLGGGTFDAAVVNTNARRARLLGTTEGIERFGGIDIDEAVLAYVDQHLDGAFQRLDPDDAEDRRRAATLRRACIAAKEALSENTEATIPIDLGATRTELRLTRSELEQMVRAPLLETVEALSRALRTANVEPAALDTVLVVGGASRMPIVGELLASALGRPTFVSPDPKSAVSVGAAFAADRTLQVPAPTPAPPPAQPPVPRAPSVSPPPKRQSRVVPAAVALLLLVLVAGAALLVASLRSSDDSAAPATTTTVSSATVTTQVVGFTPQVKAEFVDRCIAGGEVRPVCECTIDGMSNLMSFERFEAIDNQLRSDPENFELPDDVVAVITDCQAKSSATSTTESP